MPERIIQTASIALEHLDIRAEKIDLVGVQKREVSIEYFARKLIVQARILVMPVGQELGGQVGGVALIYAGLEDQGFLRIHRRQCRKTDQQQYN